MAKLSKNAVSLLFLCAFSIVLIILFILLDIYVFKIYENAFLTQVELQSNYVKEYTYIKKNKLTCDVINIDNANLEIMQIGDVVDSGTDIAEERQKILDNMDEDNVWRIKIPKINLNAPIVEGTTQSVLAKAVGHFEQTSTWEGNVALAGHNRGEYCNFFQNIKNLQIGDRIIYCTEEGEKEYKVVMNKIIKQTNWEYIEDTEDNRITLITCVENMYEYRRCIQAVEI